jgi:hypothetical protein
MGLAHMPATTMDTDLLRPLFGRVAPIAGESLLSMVARTSHQNLLDRLSDIFVQTDPNLRKLSRVPWLSSLQAERLGTLCSIPTAEIEARAHMPLQASDQVEYVTWFGTRLEGRFINEATRRVSPRSLRLSPHHRSVWSVGPLSFCPESFELLIDKCPYCDGQLQWRRTWGPANCENCRRSLRHYRVGKMPWEIRQAYRVITNLIHHSPEVRADAASRFPEPFRGWETGDIFGAIADLGSIVAADGGPVTSRGKVVFAKVAMAVAPENLVCAYRIMIDWPAGMKSFVEDYTARRMSGRSGVREVLGDLGRYALFPGKNTRLAELLRKEIPGILRQLDLPLQVTKKSQVLSEPRIINISNGDACLQFAVSNKLLSRLDEDGAAIVARRRGERGLILYDVQKLAASIKEYKTGVEEDDITRIFGIPTYCLDALVDVGLIERILDHDACLLAGGAKLFTRGSFDSLLEKVNDLPKGSSSACSFGKAMFGRLHPADWADVLEAILTRTVFARRLEANAAWTERITVDAAEIAALLRRQSRPVPSIGVSARVAARLLNVPKDFVPAMVENGFLVGSRSSRRIDIDLQSVDAFLKSYRTTRAASTWTNLHPTAIAAEMRRSGISPAGRAGKLAIWRKSDFLRVFPELER